MAHVSNVIFCLRAGNEPGVGVNASSVLVALSPEYIPGLFTFSVVISLVDLDPNTEPHISIEFVDPSGVVACSVSGTVPYSPDGSNLPREHKGLNITVTFNNANLKISGLYTLKVSVDGVLTGEKQIFVKGKNEQ